MERLFGSIPAILAEMNATSAAREAIVFAAWAQAAGEMLSERAVPVEYFENRLVVAVEDTSWQRNLEHMAPQLVARLNSFAGDGSVSFIEFRIDPAEVARIQDKSEDAGSVEIDISPSLMAAADAIGDEKLRRSFLEAASAYLDKN